MTGRKVLAAGRQLVTAAGRRAAPWLRRVPGSRYALAGSVWLALLALYGAATVARPAEPSRPASRQAPVAATVVACPDPHGMRVHALAPPNPGRRAPGVARATAGGTMTPLLTAPGVAWSADVDRSGGPWTVNAYGSVAAGLAVEETGPGEGLRCAEPAADRWFVGPGPADAEDVELTLTNVDDRAVAVDAEALSGDGPVETGDGRGTTVAPHSSVRIRLGRQPEGLGDAIKKTKIMALRVHATTGRIAASVRVKRAKGADWLPATAPGTRLVVPGVPPGDGRRRLLVAVPGDDPVEVRVRVVSPDGTLAAGGQESLLAPAAAVTRLDLGLGGKPAAIRIAADRPIVAGLVADQGDDFAAGAAVPALGQEGVVAANTEKTTLLLSAPERAASVRISRFTAQGRSGAAQDVRVPAGRTAEVPMAPSAGGYGLVLEPRPGSGPVYAARLLKNRGITLLPVPPARTAVAVPPVTEAPTVVYGPGQSSGES